LVNLLRSLGAIGAI
jgi:hypothetical protein